MVSKWEPLDLSTLPDSRWVACDPSLTATGLVYFEVKQSQVAILGAETVSTAPTGLGGWEDTFARAETITGLLRTIVRKFCKDADWTDLRAVHEAPPTSGGAMMRTESTILTGYSFRNICGDLTLPVEKLVTPMSHKYLICGNGRAKKPEHHAALKLLLPDILDGNLITNEAKRDALSIGLYAAWRLGND